MSAALDVILARLDGVRQSGRSYMARCPGHDDRTPSLRVTGTDDGRVLVHCFAGCDAGDVLTAIGLTLADLFPERPRDHRTRPIRPPDRWDARSLLLLFDREARIVSLAAQAIARGETLCASDLALVVAAHHRVEQIADIIR